MFLGATLTSVPTGILIPEERVNDASAIRLKDTGNVSLGALLS
jgi:hypothetical protein